MTHQTSLPKVTLDPKTVSEVFSGDSDLDLLAQTLSPDLALRILEEFAGLDLRVPKTMYWDHPIAEAIGLDDAQRLADYAGGDTLFIPIRHPALRAQTDMQIAAMVANGIPRRVIARCVGLGMRQLRRRTNDMGLSGVSTTQRSTKALPSPPESVFNGGLTGVSASFAAPDTSEASHDAVCVIQTKFGIYTPQPKKDQS